MSVKIILSKSSEPAEKRELVFGDETISIGREPSNVLPLPGTQVSKAHARIERQGSEYFIVDLNSTNSTYVNGERLIPGQQLSLRHGDRVSISDYELQFYSIMEIQSALPELQRQQKSGDFQNTVAGFAPAENQPASGEGSPPDPVERWSKLTAEIQKALDAFDILDLVQRDQGLQARCDALAEENRRLKAERQALPNNGEPGPLAAAEPFTSDEARLEQVTRVLLQLFSKLASGRSSFVSEFIVRTFVRTTDGIPAQSGSGDDLLRYFAGSRLSEKDFAERLALLRKEADQIVLHMMGLLEGYRRSVDEGARRLLQGVDPDRLAEDLPNTILIRYFPPLADLKLYHLVRNRLRDLLQEDRGVLEKQVFRPGFVRAYEECVEPASRA